MARILLIQTSSFELNSYQILSACLKNKGHDVDVCSLAFESFSDLINTISSWHPSIIGFTVTSFDYKSSLAVAKEIRNQVGGKHHFVFGGPHAILAPEDLISCTFVDSVCVGEGEEILCELAAAVDKGEFNIKIPGLWTKINGEIIKSAPRPFISDLSMLPADDKELYYKKYSMLAEAPFKVFTASRGCAYQCTYCSNSYLRKLIPGKLLRFRSAVQIIEEIENVRNQYSLEYVMFRSDSFTTDKKWFKELMTLYSRRIKLPFYAQVVARELTSNMIDLLAHAGMANIIFAIESGSETIRNNILKRPKITNKKLIELSEYINSKGINITTQEMFGMPTETLEDAFSTVDLCVKMKGRMTPTILQPYLHTEITKYYDTRAISEIQATHLTAPLLQGEKGANRMVVLQRISGWICRLPGPLYIFLKPLWKIITFVPDNPVLRFLSNLNYFFVQRRLSNYTGSFWFFIKYAFFVRKSFNNFNMKDIK